MYVSFFYLVPIFMEKKPTIFYLLIVIILMFFVHVPVSDKWLWDDKLLIEGNAYLHQFDFIQDLWFQDLWYGALGEHPKHFYRPMVVFDFWLDRQVSTSPVFMKWHSFLWHVGAICLTWFFFQDRMEPKQKMCMLFLPALHPFSLEITQFISARNDVMAWSFAILSGLCILHNHRKIMVIPIILSALCSLLSKESAVVYLAFVSLYLYTEVKDKEKIRMSWKSISMI